MSLELLDEQDAILAGTVVVRRNALRGESERLVERNRSLVDRRGDAADARPPMGRSDREEALVELPADPGAPLLGRDADEVDVRLVGIGCERKPIRKATSIPSSSSATKLVPSKWRKNSFGSIGAISRPPHHALTCWMTRP